MSHSLEYYCKAFRNLNVSNKKGRALYQPVLLLAITDLISQGIIENNKVFVSDELIEIFYKYYQMLSDSEYYTGGLYNPFIYLQSHKSKFWRVKFADNYDGRSIKTDKKLRRCVQYAVIDSELLEYIQDHRSKNILIDSLISAWFSNSRQAIEDLLNINQKFEDKISQNLDSLESEIVQSLDLSSKKFSLRKSPVREAFFRKSVIQIYDYRCALCRLQVNRSLTQTIVDGAHIRPYSLFWDNQITNGLSLCKNHHWAFDRGWFYINEDYKINVAEDLDEDSPHATPLRDFHGEMIQLPASEEHYPSPEALNWHFQNVFSA